jgi:hypothetical protein
MLKSAHIDTEVSWGVRGTHLWRLNVSLVQPWYHFVHSEPYLNFTSIMYMWSLCVSFSTFKTHHFHTYKAKETYCHWSTGKLPFPLVQCTMHNVDIFQYDLSSLNAGECCENFHFSCFTYKKCPSDLLTSQKDLRSWFGKCHKSVWSSQVELKSSQVSWSW